MTAKPDAFISICGLTLEAIGWEFPDSTDRWDGNWIVVDVLCRSETSQVSFRGPFLRTDEIFEFRDALSDMAHSEADFAELQCMEPSLYVAVRSAGRLGHLDVTVTVAPNPMDQRHSFTFRADQSHLRPWIAGCDRILHQFPIRVSADVL